MAKIHILSPLEAKKIAAGEVLERPASAIKELIENALDAGATRLTIIVTRGGKEQIIVEDNGSGMTAEDARLCTVNHATSKITSVQELSALTTFGFRGEALASIAAASMLTIRTRSAEEIHGIEFQIQHGELIAEKMVACPIGTRMQIDQMFANIPVRKKFLKKDETEWRAVQQLVSAFAIAHPAIDITLIHNDRHILRAQANQSHQERFCSILGLDLKEYTVAVTQQNTYASVQGLITRAPKTRYDRNSIFIFVNQRWVKNYKLAQALIKGYNNVLLPQQYPLAALFITVPADQVDINIHPRKEEVQFLHPLGVERCIEEAVRSALEAEIKTQLHATASHFVETPYKLPETYPQSLHTSFSNSTYSFKEPIAPTYLIESTIEENFTEYSSEKAVPKEIKPNEQIQYNTPSVPYTILGQLHATYILIQTEEGLLIIDQHAAHERILFEKFSERMQRAETIDLLFPQIAQLKSDEFQALIPHLPLLEQQGITIEVFGESSFLVRALPVPMKNAPVKDFLQEIAQHLLAETIKQPEGFEKLYEKLHATMACKAAIKAGDHLSTQEIHELVRQILQLERSTTCPHGRPTVWRLSLRELERNFQRTL